MMMIQAWVPVVMMALSLGAAADRVLPAGMARADDPQQVAALDRERHARRVAAAHHAATGPTEQELYAIKLAAYRTRLVEQQIERQARKEALEQEREARQQAEARARQLEALRQQQARDEALSYRLRWFNDPYWGGGRQTWILHPPRVDDCSKKIPLIDQNLIVRNDGCHPDPGFQATQPQRRGKSCR